MSAPSHVQGQPDPKMESSGAHGLLSFLDGPEIHRRVEAYNACTAGLPMELLVRVALV